MLGIYNYTVILTYIGMLVGFAGIASAADGNLHTALVCLMVAGVCDMFDGAIASTMERTEKEKRFGVQIDSLSDLVCFGALPAVIAYIAAERSTLSFCLSGLYLLCALIRLAWFNVDEEERQATEGGSRKVYLGLPVTTAALLLPALMELGAPLGWPVGKLAPLALLETERFGPVMQTEIGAFVVGGIVNERENETFCKGEEMGHFELAGSAIVLLFQKDRIRLASHIRRQLAEGREFRVTPGMCLGGALCGT